MRNNISVTALILTYNEELHISRCINSIYGIVEKVVVIDSFSTDATVDIAKELGAHVIQNPWKNHATQFNWGLDNADIDTEWILRLDADEYLENKSELVAKLEHVTQDISGIYLNRKYYFLGNWVKYGGMYPISHLRIWRYGDGRVENRWMDERTILTSGRAIHIDVNIIDDNFNTLSWWIDKHNGYATREMLDSLNIKYQFMPNVNNLDHEAGKQAYLKRFMKEKVYSRFPLFIRPFLYFFYRYIIKLGFLDGKTGFIFHFLQAFWYRMLVDFKIYEAKCKLKSENDPKNVKKILREHTLLDI